MEQPKKHQKPIPSLSRQEVIEAYNRLTGKSKAQLDIAAHGFTIQCPRCGNRDTDDISYVAMVPNYSSIEVRDGVLEIDLCNGEVMFDVDRDPTLECACCFMRWAIPSNAQVEHV